MARNSSKTYIFLWYSMSILQWHGSYFNWGKYQIFRMIAQFSILQVYISELLCRWVAMRKMNTIQEWIYERFFYPNYQLFESVHHLSDRVTCRSYTGYEKMRLKIWYKWSRESDRWARVSTVWSDSWGDRGGKGKLDVSCNPSLKNIFAILSDLNRV